MNLPKKKYVMTCHIGTRSYDNLPDADEIVLDSEGMKQLADEFVKKLKKCEVCEDWRKDVEQLIKFLRGE
jgi:hypothetical protein